MPAYVRRMQVEEGFLSGLDLRFSPGLNVIIGPRGVGKTSVIELMRFCLGASSVNKESREIANQHARSILGSGQVTVTLQDGEREILVSRSASDDRPRTTSAFRPPLVFSQTEIELVGLEARGRLQIIDGLIGAQTEASPDEEAIEAGIRSLTLEIRQHAQDLEETNDQIVALAGIPDALKAAVERQEVILGTVKKSATQAARIKVLNDEQSIGTVRFRQIEQALADLERWRHEARIILRKPPRIAEWPKAAGPDDLLASIRAAVRKISTFLEEGLAKLDQAIQELEAQQDAQQAASLNREDESRKLRKELEQLQVGAGAAAQVVAALREKAAQIEALRSRASDLNTRLQETNGRRRQALAALQQNRDVRFAARVKAAAILSKELGPRVKVSIDQGGDSPGYVGVIQSAIRGSGLHHNTLGPQLAEAMSPKELAEAVESGDKSSISALTGIGEERSLKVIAAISRAGTENIITAPINDRVTMSLLDGKEYKATTHLSTGQRCTVVLSVLLESQGRGLVIDQPEDHLDNAFIVDTLVSTVLRKKKRTQMIFATHNANIPVLGDAETVALLGSDGKRGFVSVSGSLTEQGVVTAIMSVMEGGQEAFERRAMFYGKYVANKAK